MKHIYTLSEANLDRPSIVTIGVFDGVHRGHQHLLRQMVAEARSSGRLAAVLTLFPHPDRVLRGLTGRYYLTTPEEKADLLGELGIDVVITHPFDDQVRQIRAAAFVDQLRQHLKMNSLWITADFAMGYRREGNFDYLSSLGAEQGFEVRQVDLLRGNGTAAISSSAIREALLVGDIEKAADWLGRPYRLGGQVVHGDNRGHMLGFPTANLKIWEEQVIPSNGIYACWALFDEDTYMGMTNVGERPTFGGKDIRVEAYLLDFDQDIYGQRLTLDFIARLRDEEKFNGVEALIAQMRADVAHGRAILSARRDQTRTK